MINEIDILAPLNIIVDSKNYEIDHVEFRNIIGKILEAQKKLELKSLLEIFLFNAPNDFYKSHLSIVILSVYEKYLNKEKASEIANKIIKYSSNQPSYALASLLRICRNKGSYKQVDLLFEEQTALKKINTFEVLYELTFYYNSKNNIEAIDAIISQLISTYRSNMPILKTASALCIRYGLYEKYQHLLTPPQRNFISDNKNSIIKEIEEEEYEKVFRSAALADLTNGIAHEFGQPVTNIRFGIQYYSKIFTKDNDNKVDKEKVLNIFNDILVQTERIGRLINRLSPITSTKSINTQFDLVETLKQIFEQEKIKLQSYDIDYEFKLLKDFSATVKFDFTQFNQIVSNLLNNSIDSIVEKKINNDKHKGKIFITIKDIGNKYSIWFVDNGKGIPQSDYDRIFNPFYTTKPPDKGQGLGLYIVSNLLKMNGGNISFDRSHKNGAKFIIIIPQNKEL